MPKFLSPKENDGKRTHVASKTIVKIYCCPIKLKTGIDMLVNTSKMV